MTTTDIQKTLTGVTVGLSVSATSEMAALGVNAAEVTHMKEVIAQHLLAQGCEIASEHASPCHACICIGGRTEGANGYYPSVFEDVLSTLQAEQPLYLSGVIGGAAEQVISALRQAVMPADFGQPWGDGQLPPKEIWKRLMSVGVAGLARHNGLSVAENEALFKATNMSQISEAVVLGLSRLRTANLP
ncbi:hypothetical protein [Candidatus Entotheonella palauensis]|uniref:Uncharacterized protein n=1 Tax=Candidatus Entotheonella gemina TaxID=1429439 RepID=W4MA63_9BACT|nr:hypothetical protein [Candidatus Entotheonella palauensis]ETX07093.1 MAG: hypothetical protein ETSY2_13225 [Candidatus Entotheonella gemina]